MDVGKWFKRRVGEFFLWTVFWAVIATAAESIVNGWWNIDWIEIALAMPVAFMAAVLFVYLRDLSRYEKSWRHTWSRCGQCHVRELVGKNMRRDTKVKKR